MKQGLSQAELARKSGVPQSLVKRMEYPEGHKDWRRITPRSARLLAPVLNTTVFFLTGSLDAAADGLPAKEKERIARMIDAYRVER